MFEAPPDRIKGVVQIEQQITQSGKTGIIIEFHASAPSMKGMSGIQATQFRSSVEQMQTRVKNELSPHLLESVREYKTIPAMALWTDSDGIQELLQNPDVKAIHYDEPSLPHLAQSVPIVGADNLWSLGYTGAGQAIVILDTGVDSNHEFFTGKIVEEACFSTNNAGNNVSSLCPDNSEEQLGTGSGMDCTGATGCGHGTHVAGIAAGSGPTLDGVAKGADIIAIQVFSELDDVDGCGSHPAPCVRAYVADQLAALDYINENLRNTYDIASVNMSLGGGEHTSACDEDIRKSVIDDLRANNIATVIASGNDGYDNAIGAPSCISSAIAVGNTLKNDNVASGSNSSVLVDLLAPGTSINSSVMGGGYDTKTGTSMAAPHVAGAIALMRESNPDESLEDVLVRLEKTGVPISDSKNGIVKPRIDVQQAASTKHITQSISSPVVWGEDATTTYIIENSISIHAGGELSILPGVEVRFDEGVQLTVSGDLNADNVLFTANNETPSYGFWRRFYVDGGSVTMTNSDIEFAGSSSSSAFHLESGGQLTLTDTEIRDSYRGMQVFTGTVDLESVLITRMNNHGAYIESDAVISMFDTEISETIWPVVFNGPGALTLGGTTTISENENQAFYIGHTTLSKDFTIPAAPVPYYFPNHYTVNTGHTFTVDPANILKINNNRRLTIHGTLIADAVPDSTIYFTSYEDDNLGGDTNNDGSASSPGATSWNGIDITENSGTSSVLRNVQVSFAGTTSSGTRRGALNLLGSSPTVDQSTFLNNQYGITLFGTASPTLTENTIGVSTLVPIAMEFSASPIFTNNTFSFQANQYDAIGLIGGDIPADAYLPKRDVTAIENVTYLLLENVTVPVGITLEIEEGVVIKSLQNRRITVAGNLLASGTDSEKIVFTSWKDDNFGNPNDTNKDGNQTVPQVGDWYGLYFTPDADDTSILDHIIIQFARSNNISFASQNYSGAAIMVAASSPTISNSEIRNVNVGIGLVGDSKSAITNNSFVNTASVPVALSMASDPVFSGNTFTNAEIIALGLFGESLGLDGEVNKKNFGGITNITYFIKDNITINSNAKVAVDPGVVFKASSNTNIYVDGGFQINGTAEEKVVFTSFRDDNFGNPGDTNNDGNATSPSSNDWGTVMYRGTSDDVYNIIEYAEFRFGRVGLAFRDAAPTVRHTLLSEAQFFGITADGAAEPVFEHVTIRNMNLDPILLSVKANPSFSNIIFDANDSQGIRLLEGYSSSFQLHNYITNTTTVGSDAILFQRDIAGINNIAYVVSTTMTIAQSARLTVNPGVVMKFHNSGNIRVDGAMIADGTENQRIVFTDIRDDSSGGDTNNDGNESSPSRGFWNGIEFRSSGLDAENRLVYSDVRYAASTPAATRSSVIANSAFVLVENSTIEQSSGSAVAVLGNSQAEFRNNEMINITGTPVRMNMFAHPVFEDNIGLNAGSMAIGIISETYSVDGVVPVRDFGGHENITYELLGNVTINSGTVISIPEGITFKRNSSNRFIINGALKVLGTNGNPVVFTHLSDDDFGSPADTQNDGTASSPGIINTPWFDFKSSSNDSESIIEHTVIRYAGFGIELNSSAPTIRDNTFEHSTWGIDLAGVSKPIVQNNLFRDLNRAPMRISLVSYPDVTEGNVIEGSTFKAIGIVNETLVQDVTLPAREFAGIERMPYYLEGVYTIGTGAVLTLEPGVIMKFNGGSLDVRKGLVAQGGNDPDGKIVFTDYRDDFYGGDTNADSSDTSPSTNNFGSWNGIRFMSESLAPFSILDNVIIKHAYHNSRGAVTAENASPTITNSILSKNRYGVYATGNANPVINFNDIYDNLDHGVYNRDESFIIDATFNWWGKDTGPEHATNPQGTGDEVSDAVDFDPWNGEGATRLSLGDVSLNGSVGAFDASLVLRESAGSVNLSPLQLQNADVSGDGTVSAFDASLILQYIVNRISFFPAEAAQKAVPEDLLVHYDISDVSASIQEIRTEPGSTFTVPLVLDDVQDLLAFQVVLQLDGDWLLPEEVETTEITKDMQVIHRYDSDKNLLYISAAGISPISRSGEFLQLTFEVMESNVEQARSTMRFSQVLANEKDVTAFSAETLVTIENLPEEFALAGNYPNPFNPSTKIAYQLPENVHVRLSVYDVLGRLVAVLVNEDREAGRYEATFDAASLASGVYIYRIEAGDFVESSKMLLVK